MKLRRFTDFPIRFGGWRWPGFHSGGSDKVSRDRAQIVRDFYRLAEYLNEASQDQGAHGRARRFWIKSQMRRLKGDEDRLRNGTESRD